MQNPFQSQPITEEQIYKVVNYFDTWDTWWESESRIRLRYWKMKANWSKIDKAEEEIAKAIKRRQESYRWQKEQEINKHLKEYRQEKQWENGIYELMRLNEWEDWRTMVLWFMENFDTERQKQRWSHVVEIEERLNPDYFQEIVKRFNLVID